MRKHWFCKIYAVNWVTLYLFRSLMSKPTWREGSEVSVGLQARRGLTLSWLGKIYTNQIILMLISKGGQSVWHCQISASVCTLALHYTVVWTFKVFGGSFLLLTSCACHTTRVRAWLSLESTSFLSATVTLQSSQHLASCILSISHRHPWHFSAGNS